MNRLGNAQRTEQGLPLQPRRLKRLQKYAWPAALVTALGIHGCLALLRIEPVWPLNVPDAAAHVVDLNLLELADEELPQNEPRGGSPTPKPAELAKPLAAVTPSPPKKAAPPRPRVNALDPLLAEAFNEPSTFALPKPKAARTTFVGTGPGRKAGPGGVGQGNGRVVKEKFVFGGPEGAFQADVCALPKGTASIGLVTDCPHLLTFFADRINVPRRHFREGFPGIEDRVEWFGIKYTGQFKVRETGIYEFRLSSDDGSRLIIDDQLVINNDGAHAPTSRSGRIQLAAGSHQLKLLYFQGTGSLLSLQLFVTAPRRHEKPFRPEF